MEAFQSWSKPLPVNVKLSDLPYGEYPVRKFFWLETRFGPKIKLDLGDKYVFLPNSIAKKQSRESIDALNMLPQIFVWNGYGDSQYEP